MIGGKPGIVRCAAFSVCFAAILSVTVGCDDDSHGGGVKVMTQNVYFGFDVNPLMAAQSPDEIPVLAAQAFMQLLSTDFPERAETMADKIALERPHLIGLQEVALIRIQSPGDAVVGGTAQADTVLLDYLEILTTALEGRGLEYEVAGLVENLDIEIPMITGVDPMTFDDIRLTGYDVVLARSDVEVSDVVAANFQAKAFVPSLGISIPRGYVALDARIPGANEYRFASVHLEDAPFLDVQLQQAQELAAVLGSETGPVILVGDTNSPAPDGGTYAFFEAQGYVDTWTENNNAGEGEGLTWGHDPDLRNAAPAFTVRIDMVFVRPESSPAGADLVAVVAEVWGDELDERTPTGLWPSDHGAVIARLQFAPRPFR